ncbi:MAG: preprotein translocase subunit SecA [Patescibacteria group bacterium]|nr:preprotein translocase subunit SecA [Patescibacteria group bacterium]
MANIFKAILGDANESSIKKLNPKVAEINALEPEMQKLSDVQLKEKTKELQEQLKEGKSLDDVLVEAFTLTREAAVRTLDQRHFDVQLIGGIVLHQGKIAEMRTGEGKTLTSTLAIYLNALEGKGVHLVTVNDYLTKRDTVWMGQIYHALGISVGCIAHDSSFVYDPDFKGSEELDEERDDVGGFKVQESYLRPVERKEAYAADVTYGTNNEFGFDYLRDNMAYSLEAKVQRGHNYVIIDEVDSVLIDESRTPLIISAPDSESSNWYADFARLIPQLKKDEHYQIDEKMKAVTLTEVGIDKVEALAGVKDIYQEKGIKYLHHLEQALKAQTLFQRDKDYVVREGQVMIVDEFTGRLLPGRRFSGGLHQALEAKEGVQVQAESITLASVTFQNYFRMYKKIAGMTGTAATSAEEFHKVYHLDTVIVPPNKPIIREDKPDRVYKTANGKLQAVVKEIKERHEKGQPVLIGTVSIEKNEQLGRLLTREGIQHKILNAKQHEQEGEIIAQAGRLSAVTVATNMAGRGVDIVLGGNPASESEAEKVKAAGGLHIIGTERHEARRIDNQLRGRSGRQGDPGSSVFLVSLEDDLMRIFGGDRIKGMMDKMNIAEDQPIESKIVTNALGSAQSKVEGMNFDARKHLLDYDDVLNHHREAVYKKRNEILELAEKKELKPYLIDIVLSQKEYSEQTYMAKEEELGEERMAEAEKFVPLKVIDSLWMEHLENMEQLRDSVRLRAYGQKDPLVEYKSEGHRMYKDLLSNMDNMIAHSLMRIQVNSQNRQPHSHVTVSQSRANKIGRNDPCPCGSGLKYKRCGMINSPQHKG